MSSIDKINVGGTEYNIASSNEIAYGTCTTSADTAAKEATLEDAGNWTLKKGCMVAIKFTNTNTFSAASGSPVTLNVNNTGAKNIYWGNSSNPTGTNTTPFGRANYINTYLYDGTYWVWQGSSADNNQTGTRQYPTNTTDADYRVLLSYGANDDDETNLTRKDTNFKYNPNTNNLSVVNVNGVPPVNIFLGTRTEWDALSATEKAKHKFINFRQESQWAVDKYMPVTLWTGDVGDYAGATSYTINLSQSYKSFKFLRFYFMISVNANAQPNRPVVREISTEQLDYIRTSGLGGQTLSMAWGYVANATPPDSNYVDIQSSSTETTLLIASRYCKIQKIEGVCALNAVGSLDPNGTTKDIYENAEHEIGTFFGKTLYRRCINLGDGSGYGLSLNSTEQNAIVNLGTLFGFTSNYEVTNIDIKVFRTDGGNVYFNNNFILGKNGDSTATQIVSWWNRANLNLYVHTGAQYNAAVNSGLMKLVACIEYTKERIAL